MCRYFHWDFAYWSFNFVIFALPLPRTMMKLLYIFILDDLNMITSNIHRKNNSLSASFPL
jgi:hypothetical protein